MRFHCLAVPHTVTNHAYVGCAFTQKVLKFCKMMKARGHHIIHYGHEDSDVDCNQHVTVITNKDLEIAYGNYDWRKQFFKFDMNDHAYKTFYKNAIEEVAKRKQQFDFILPFWGQGVKPVCDAHDDMICVEPGIGYPGGTWAKWRVYESYALLHADLGIKSVSKCINSWYHVVIPNYFDPNDFEFSQQKEDYALFLGRICSGKGIQVALQVSKAVGIKLKVAGQGDLAQFCNNGVIPDHVEYIGYADLETRKKLMSKAKFGIISSLYTEPFGGVQVEFLMSGTPTITTDWGAFVENNIHGVTGYRCRTFEQFCWAAKNIDTIKPIDCYNFAKQNFTFEKVGNMYEEYFTMVMNVHKGKGWYEPNEQRQSLDYLKKDLSPPNAQNKKLVINTCKSYKHCLEKLFESLKSFKEEIIVVIGDSDHESEPHETILFNKNVICIELLKSNYDFHGFSALYKYYDHPLIKADGYMYISDTCIVDETFPRKFNELYIKKGNTYVFGTPNDIIVKANQSFICAFSCDVICEYGNAFDKIITKKEGVDMEAGIGISITKYGKVNYISQRQVIGCDDYYNEGKMRFKSYYKEFGLYKFYHCINSF